MIGKTGSDKARGRVGRREEVMLIHAVNNTSNI